MKSLKVISIKNFKQMKQTKRYILGSLLASILFVSCNNSFEPVFDKPADERLNDVFDSCRTVLTDAPYGWEMYYFIDNHSKGYNLIMDFTSANNVTIAGNNDITNNSYKESASTYELNNSNGPLIAFDTYNEVLHPFADPDPYGYSMGGDFEFIIINVSPDEVKVRGKKNSLNLVFNRINDDVTPANYLNEINAIRKELFSSGSPDYTLEVDGNSTDYIFTGGTSSVFKVKNEAKNESFTYAFLSTRTGIRLCIPEEISGMDVQTFLLNDDKSALVGDSAHNVKLVGPSDIAGYFMNTNVNWVFNNVQMSDDIKALYQQTISSVEGRYPGADDIYLALVGEPLKNQFSLRLGFIYRGKKVEADLYMDTEKTGNASITLTYKNDGNSAGLALAENITSYSKMAVLLSTSYNLETDYPLTVKNLKLINSTNSATWFKVAR